MNIRKTGIKIMIALLVTGGAFFMVTIAPKVSALSPSSTRLANIQWAPCPDLGVPVPANLECGTLSVPLNYSQPNGQKINIAVSRLKATKPALRQGVMLLNPGGPGGVGLDMPIEMSQLMPQSVVSRYDLIGFDPRGVGYSAPVSCGLTYEQSLQIAPPLEQNNNFNDTAIFMHQVADGCAQHSGAQLPYNTTANTARDMNRIRLALGENKISYFAYSYGTYLGAVYAALYPNQTDRFVLDSATNSRGAWREMFRSWGVADVARFPDFAQYLIDHEDRYHLGSTQAEVRQTFFDLAAKVRANPILFPDGTLLNDPWFRVVSFAGLYDDAYFKNTGDVWKIVKETGNGAALQPLVNNLKPRMASASNFPTVPDDNSSSATNAVLCDDSVWSRSVQQYQQELNADVAQYPMFAILGSNIWPCAFWANDPVEPPVAITENGPAQKILIVQNQRDPATPYPNGIEMRQALGNRARLLSVVQGGHGASYGAHNTCAKDLVTTYLITGVMMPSDSTCPAESSDSAANILSDTEKSAMRQLRHRMW